MEKASAANRLATLQRHLRVVTLNDESFDVDPANIRPNCTSVAPEAIRPAPGGGKGVLTAIDSRTGKKYEIEISEHGTIKATDLKKITAGGDNVGLRTYDPG